MYSNTRELTVVRNTSEKAKRENRAHISRLAAHSSHEVAGHGQLAK